MTTDRWTGEGVGSVSNTSALPGTIMRPSGSQVQPTHALIVRVRDNSQFHLGRAKGFAQWSARLYGWRLMR